MTYLETHGTRTVVDVNSLAPRVLAVNVATVEVDIRRLVRVGDGVLTGQNQRVESDGTLWTAGVDLGDLMLQLTLALHNSQTSRNVSK